VCFDEYNRIHLEVMEETIKMIHSVLAAMKDNKSEVTVGQHAFNIKQGDKSAWIATLNPGYAGRQPLPEI
jgi:hypothetical protein